MREASWNGISNGALLSIAEERFDVLVTIDQGVYHQQNHTGRKIALVILQARSNDIDDLKPLVPGVLEALLRIQPGEILRVAQP